MEEELLIKWEPSGLLEGIESMSDKLNLIRLYEEMVDYILSTADTPNIEPHRVDTIIFPCIRRVYSIHKRIFNPIRLYVMLKDSLDTPETRELFDDLNSYSNIDTEAEFTCLFCEGYELECELKPIKNIPPFKMVRYE